MSEYLGGHDLTGKKALVIGGSRGLGGAMAKGLAQAGADVAISSRTVEADNPVAQAIAGMGRRALTVACDASRTADVQALIQQVNTAFGGLDILIHSAGIAREISALKLTEEDWDGVLGTNLRSAFFAAQAAAQLMKDAGGGRIIFVSSMLGQVAQLQGSAYIASKAGMNGLTRALALEWARWGINVNAIAPGYVKTALNAHAFDNPKILQLVTDKIPMRRLGLEAEMCGTALLLAGQGGSYLTGQVLTVDGGYSIQ